MICAPLSRARVANVRRKLWNVRFSCIGPTCAAGLACEKRDLHAAVPRLCLHGPAPCDAGARRRRITNVKKLAFLAVVAIASRLIFAVAAQASCIPMSPAEERARADVIFDGVVLDGPTATGVQRFRVSRYLKGRGPRIVRVATGNIRRTDGSGSVTSVSIIAARGQRWRIFARGSPWKVLRTTVCDGSGRQ